MDNMALAWDTPQEDELAMNQMSRTSPYAPLLFPRKEKSFRPFCRSPPRAGGPTRERTPTLNPAIPRTRTVEARVHLVSEKDTACCGRREQVPVAETPVHTARVRLMRSLPRRRRQTIRGTRSRCCPPRTWRTRIIGSATSRGPPCWTCRSSSCTRRAAAQAYREDVAAMEAEERGI